MANEAQLKILKQGVKFWNEWREENDGIDIDLSFSNLSEANLSNSDFSNSDLSDSDFFYANFSTANLSFTNLSEADLSYANLSYAVLEKANFKDCYMHKTILGLTNLNTAIGLESVKVLGECTIDFQTLRNSKNIPKEFLLKIGLPENYINYLPDFYDQSPMRLFPVFLSHSWTNKDFAGKLYNALIKKGVQVWYDEKKLKPGDKTFEGLTKAINVYDKMILVCSKESLEESWWVDEEMNRIFKKERKYLKEKNKKVSLLIPITIDKHIYKWDGAKGESIRDKVIGDFSEWKDDAKFEVALNKLIEALNVDRERDEGKPASFLDGI